MVKRHVTLPSLISLDKKKYMATIYADAKEAHYKNQPTSLFNSKIAVTNKSKISQLSAAGGGYATV
jgi:hypothetical protein